MTYVRRYADGRVARTVGLGADPVAGVPSYVTAIIQQIEAKYPLNADSIQKLMDAFSKALSDEAKKEATQRAAVSAGIAAGDMAMAFIPIIGWALAAIITVIYAVVQAGLQVTQTYFRNEAAKLQSATENYLRTLAAQYQAQLLAFQGQVIEQEAPAAYQLAVSGQTLQGLGSFSWQRSLATAMRTAVEIPMLSIKPVQQAQHALIQSTGAVLLKVPIPVVQHAAQTTMNIDNRNYHWLVGEEKKYDDFIKVGTGELQLQKVQEACANVRAAAEVEFKRQYHIALANSDSPVFRAAMRNALAAIFRTDPTINSLMSQVVASVASGTAPSLNMSVQQPSKGLQAIPMVATGAAVAALLFLKK